jgi:hypothetical protein
MPAERQRNAKLCSQKAGMVFVSSSSAGSTAEEATMISVVIAINGQPVMARSATNIGDVQPKGHCRYLVDDGSTITHRVDDGAVKLAIELLKTIKEQGISR